MAQRCKGSERAVSWSVTGPAGPEGPAGALDTTPVNVGYASTSTSSHDVSAVGGVVLRLECGTSRIGMLKADLVTQADQVHGTSVLTVYNGQTILSSTPYAINTQSQTDLDGASVLTPGSTHAELTGRLARACLPAPGRAPPRRGASYRGRPGARSRPGG